MNGSGILVDAMSMARTGVRAIMWACANYRGTGHGFLRLVIQRGVETAATGIGWLLRICGVLFLNCARLGGPDVMRLALPVHCAPSDPPIAQG